ncbi:MAG: integrin alpha, partial [Bacteroidota bacterium]
PSSIDTSSLNGTTGFSITGNSDRLGGAVSNAGDINGDNIDDLIIGATGKSYIIFGKSSSFSPNLNASTLNGMNGFTINGNAAGTSVSSAGDINDDGIGDIIIGTGNSGDAYVVFGNSTGFSSNLELSTLDGSDGFMVNGRGDRSYVSSAGDVNDDGLDDIIIGSPSVSTRANGEGECYLIFGQSNFNSILDVSSLNGSNGFTLFNNDGIIASIGNSVSGGYDINNDNIDDFIIGAPRATPSNGNTRAGKSYIVFGGQNKFTQSSFELSGLDGDNGFVISGFEDRGEFGYSVSGLEDVNGDGIDDLITSAHYSNNYYGQCFVVFGKQGCITVSPTLSVTVSSPQIEEDSGLNTLIYTFTASLSPTCEDLTVKFAVSGDATYNDDYYLVRGSENFNGSTGTTIIPVGQTSVDLVFQTQQDAIFESDESIIVMIENP